MKKITKVLICLLSPLALVSCGCTKPEIKWDLGESTEIKPATKDDKDVEEVEGIISYDEKNADGNSFTAKTSEKGIKVKIVVKKTYKPCKQFDGKKYCSKKTFTDSTEAAKFLSLHNDTEIADFDEK